MMLGAQTREERGSKQKDGLGEGRWLWTLGVC